jgi:VWFA-related protein
MRPAILRAVILGILVFTLAFPIGRLIAHAAPVPAERTSRQDQQQQGQAQQGQAQQGQAQQGQSQQQQGQQQQDRQQAPGGYSINMQVPVVDVDAVVTDGNGNFLPNLKKENFRVLEDGKPQQIANFGPSDAPMTVVLLIEFSKLGGEYYAYNSRMWAPQFLGNLKPTDWIALEDFDLKTRVDVDFTHNPGEVMDYLRQMIFPGFREACLFDAILETVDRLKDVKGKKAILVLASGYDTFSKHTLDNTIKELRTTDVSIYAVGTGQWLQNVRGGVNGQSDIRYEQAKNQLHTFAEMTGGQSWFPAFEGEIPGIFQDVAASLRNQYSIGYVPSANSLDGKYHKIKIELVAPDGGPLTITDQKGKKVKFVVYARQGYTAPKNGVGD